MTTTAKALAVPLLLSTACAAAAVTFAVPVHAGPLDCVSGYVWRNARDGDAVCVTPATRDAVAQQNANPGANKDPNGAYGPQSCAQGFVWREAFDGDTICVTPNVRAATLADNAAAESRKQANQPAPPPAQAPAGQNPLCGLPNPLGAFPC